MVVYRRIEVPFIRQCIASTITMMNAGVTITIARCVWTPHHWNALVALLLSIVTQGLSWVGGGSVLDSACPGAATLEAYPL